MQSSIRISSFSESNLIDHIQQQQQSEVFNQQVEIDSYGQEQGQQQDTSQQQNNSLIFYDQQQQNSNNKNINQNINNNNNFNIKNQHHQNMAEVMEKNNQYQQEEDQNYSQKMQQLESFLENQTLLSNEQIDKIRISHNVQKQQSLHYHVLQTLLTLPQIETKQISGDLDAELEEYKKLEKYFSQYYMNYQNEFDGIHMVYQAIGNTYLQMGELFMALDNYLTAQKLVKRVYDNMDYSKIQYSLALIYQSQKQFQSSLMHLMQGFSVQVRFLGEKSGENLTICRKIINILKQLEGDTQQQQIQKGIVNKQQSQEWKNLLLTYCTKYLQIAKANGCYTDPKNQLEYYSIVKCQAKLLLSHKQYTQGINLLEESLTQLQFDYIDFDNQQIYVYEISKLLVQFYKHKVEYVRCEDIFQVLITLSKNIYGENSKNTAQLYSDMGHLQNVLLFNDRAFQSLQKGYEIYKKISENSKNNNNNEDQDIMSEPEVQQIIITMNKVNQDLHNQTAIQTRFKSYDHRNEKILLTIMEEFNRVGKLYAKRAQIQKALKNYEMSQILFNQLPKDLQNAVNIQKMENKLLLNYAIVLIKQNQSVLALVYLNKIKLFEQELTSSNDINNEKFTSTENMMNSQQNMVDFSNEENFQNLQDNFQVFYRKGVCYEQLGEKLLSLECYMKAYSQLTRCKKLEDQNLEKQEQLQHKIMDFSGEYNLKIDNNYQFNL